MGQYWAKIDPHMPEFPLVRGGMGEAGGMLPHQNLAFSPTNSIPPLSRKLCFCNIHVVFGDFGQNISLHQGRPSRKP